MIIEATQAQNDEVLQSANTLDEYSVTFQNGQTRTITASCLRHCIFGNDKVSKTVVSYKPKGV
ncbi:hypothetical protein ACFFU3_00985 [Vibrio agarivorans]